MRQAAAAQPATAALVFAAACRETRIARNVLARQHCQNGEGYTGTRPCASFFAFAPQPGQSAGEANCFGV